MHIEDNPISESVPEEPQPQTQQTPPQVIVQQSSRQSFWLLAAVALGFALPIFACAVLGLVSIFFVGMGSAALSDTALDSGVGPAVAIVRVEGAIIGTDDTAYLTGAGSGTVIADLKAAEANDDVKAIVLRVDSPGGTVTGSAQIHEYIVEKVEKPVIVSMASTAASGGYYVSAGADYIFARADTVTGSLGVIMSIFNVAEFMDEWGIDVVNLTSGPNKALGSPFEEVSPEHVEILRESIDESYDQFVKIIAEGRDMDPERVREIADGRIYSGKQAFEIGLVDELGNFSDAIAHAADMGGIEGEPRIIEFERVPGIEDLLTTFGSLENRSTAQEIRSTMEEYGIPKLEYRYAGP